MTRALAVLSTLSLVVACGNTPPITSETPDANLLEMGSARANVHWGDRDYLVQQMWVNGSDGGGCALHP